MKALEKRRPDGAMCQVSPADFSVEHIAVAFLVQRFSELPGDSIRDIVSLMEAWTNPETPTEDKTEIFETIREILFPELIGNICEMPNVPTEQLPEQVRRRADYIGRTIQMLRDEKGWTQMELAEKARLQQSHISRLEAGVHSPSLKTLEKIANAFGVTVGDIDPSN